MPILPVGVSYARVDESPRYSATIRTGAPFELSSTVDTGLIRELDCLSRRGLTDASEEHQLHEEIAELKHDGRVVLDAVQALQDLSRGYPVIDNAYSYTED